MANFAYLRRRRQGGGGGGSYDPAATALFAAYATQPSDEQKTAINNLIVSWKADGFWAKADAIWLQRAHSADAGLFNIKNPAAFKCTAVNSPTFTASRGYAGNATTMYLNTGWNASVNGVNYQRDSASMGYYLTPSVGTAAANDSIIPMGNQTAFLRPRMVSGAINGKMQQSSQSTSTSLPASRFGLTSINRPDASNETLYRDGASQGTVANASMPLADWGTGPVLLLAYNNVGTGTSPALHSDNQMGFAWVGGSLTAGEHAALSETWYEYVAATASFM